MQQLLEADILLLEQAALGFQFLRQLPTVALIPLPWVWTTDAGVALI